VRAGRRAAKKHDSVRVHVTLRDVRKKPDPSDELTLLPGVSDSAGGAVGVLG